MKEGRDWVLLFWEVMYYVFGVLTLLALINLVRNV